MSAARPVAVSLQDVHLSYRTTSSQGAGLKELVVHAWRRQNDVREFEALRGISFDIAPGEVLGVIGSNGAGKSTLMKVVARVLPPTRGRVRVRGQVAPLIELGAGFDPELSGAENVVLYGTLLGRRPQDMQRLTGSILDWAGLEEFRDVPLRAYSSGMTARLAFAIAVDADPDVLLVDEVLSVGDGEFQQRSRERLNDLIRKGSAVMLVSHDVVQVRSYASEVLWLKKGLVHQKGAPEPVTRAYELDYQQAAAKGRPE